MSRLGRTAKAIIVGIALALSSWTPALAIAYPDAPGPTMVDQYAFRNLLATGDSLFLFYAIIPYAVTPAIPEPEAYVWSLIDTDGISVLGTTSGTDFNKSGYGYNLYSMYFPVSAGLTWGAAYTARLTGTPAAFGIPLQYNFPIPPTAYTSLITQEDNQAQLAATILSICADLNNRWGLSSTADLLFQSETATVLSLNGQAFIRAAIFGAQGLAPTAFDVVLQDINAPDRTWTDNYTTTLGNQWAGTWVQTAQQGATALFGTGWDLADLMVLLVAFAAVLFSNIVLTGDAWNGMIDGVFILIIGARLGAISLGYLAVIVAICLFYIGMKIWNAIPR